MYVWANVNSGGRGAQYQYPNDLARPWPEVTTPEPERRIEYAGIPAEGHVGRHH